MKIIIPSIITDSLKNFLQLMLPLILIYLFIFLDHAAGRQADSIRTRLESDLERAIEELDPEDAENESIALIEYLYELSENPININRAGVNDLMLIPGLNLRLATNIIQYRSENAPFESLDQLTLVSGIGPSTLDKMRPYISTGSGFEKSRDLFLNRRYWLDNARTEFYSRYRQTMEKQEGYLKPDTLGGFAGSQAAYYHRLRFNSRRISVNITQDKDPGEKLRGLNGFDYSSWHVALQNAGKMETLIIGDYSVAFGQGLLLWTGGSFGKGRDVVKSAIKSERGIRPFTSAQESAAFRGAAFTYGNRFQLNGFYSRRKRTSSEIDDIYVRFPTQSGYHRTLNELERRNNLGQTTYGGRLRYRFQNGLFGLTGFRNNFSRQVQKGNQPYQLYRFEGRTLDGFSADAGVLIGPAYFFSESAFTSNGGLGALAGTELTLSKKTEAVFLFRRYDKNFNSIFGAAFGEQSGTPSNEHGYYAGIQHKAGSRITISGYFDQFRFPAPRFQTRQPTSGHDRLILFELFPVDNMKIYALFRHKGREEEYQSTDEFGRDIQLLGNYRRSGFRFQTEWLPFSFLRVRNRAEMVETRRAGSDSVKGFLLFQDFRVMPLKSLQIDARLTRFNTDDYDSRLYQFENDLLYVMSNTLLFEKGWRMYTVIHFKPSDKIEFWLKYASTIYDERSEISSGNLRIDGNRRSDIGIQARLRF